MASTAVGNSVASAQVSVTNAATKIFDSRISRKSVLVVNQGAADVFVGGSAVTTANGAKVAAGAALSINDLNGPLFGIVAAGTNVVGVLEVF